MRDFVNLQETHYSMHRFSLIHSNTERYKLEDQFYRMN